MDHVHVERREAVGILTLARPERFNSLDVRTAQDLRKAGLALARDPAVRCVVLRGQPQVFCSGADLRYVRDGGDPADLAFLTPGGQPGYGAVFKQILEYLHSTISEIRRSDKPWIAAVDGVAAAGGLGLAMCCDLVIASERASFEWAYGRTGLTGAESSTFYLPRLAGLRFAMEMVLLNPRLDAQSALRAGLITGVFPAAGFDDEVLIVARKIAEGPTHAYGVSKALLNQAAGLDRLDFHLDRELEELVRAADAPEFAARLAAFFEKK
jgi:2-(1,2-epoxy-1,2-dihydrophenyl)acetyl-CoA isomerase